MQLTSAYRTLINLPSIWSNQNLSDGEKFLQTLTGISTVLPTLITQLPKLSSNISTFLSAILNVTVPVGAVAVGIVALTAAITGIVYAISNYQSAAEKAKTSFDTSISNIEEETSALDDLQD
jgi:hypothetical protein